MCPFKVKKKELDTDISETLLLSISLGSHIKPLTLYDSGNFLEVIASIKIIFVGIRYKNLVLLKNKNKIYRLWYLAYSDVLGKINNKNKKTAEFPWEKR